MGYEHEKNWDEARRQQALRRRRELRRRKLRRQRIKKVIVFALLAILGLIVCIFIWKWIFPNDKEAAAISGMHTQGLPYDEWSKHPEWTEDFLTPNEYSRPGFELPEVKNIFVHYVSNPNTTAKQNRDYFEDLGVTGERSASSHFIIDLDGEIIQCVPLGEIAYAVKKHNYSSISIECCHPDESGKFSDATYESLIKLLRWLLDVYDLEKDDILRHYDSNGKLCPIYYVEHEDAWEQLKNDV